MKRRSSVKRPMVLYHAVSSYQLLEVMLHRKLVHSQERAVLLLPDFITEKYPWYRKLASCRFFDEVYLFPYLHIPHTSEAQVTAETISACRAVLPYPLTAFQAVYVAGAHFYFSLCLIQQQIPFVFFEDAVGMLSRSEELKKNLSVRFSLHAQIAAKYGLFDGSCPAVSQIVCLKKAQTRDVSDDKYRDFSVMDALAGLSQKERRRFCRIFLKHPLHTSADAVLLTQHFANLGILSENGQRQLYASLRDGLLQGVRLVIKKHPDDTLDYRLIFPDARVIRQVFPSELLPFVFRRKPKTVYTFSSTGAESLSPYFSVVRLDSGRPAGR